MRAQQKLGMIYENGELGIDKNYNEAIKWYRFAAVQPYSIAAFRLGLMYFDGRGVSENRVIAIALLNINTNVNDSTNTFEMIRQKMNEDEINAAKALCEEMIKGQFENNGILNNFIPALDRYSSNPKAKEEAIGDCCPKPRIVRPPYGCVSIHN